MMLEKGILYTENQILFAMTFAVTIIRVDKAFAYLAEISRMQIRVGLQYFGSFINNFSLHLLGVRFGGGGGLLHFN